MATLSPPYFFDEFLLPAGRKQPTPRERALGFTVKDLEWLHTLYYATDAARQDPALHTHPMQVERLLINRPGKPALTLTGAFLMSPTPDDSKAVLYTPYGGLELFDSRAVLLAAVHERLQVPAQRDELLCFMSIAERDALPVDTPVTISTAIIQGAVMQDQEDAILASQQQNVLALLTELRKLPSLHWMLDTLLAIMARTFFPKLDQADTRVDFFSRAAQQKDRLWLASQPLREALLQFYAKQDWPQNQTHVFVNIGYDSSALTADQRALDQQRWDSVVEQTSGILSSLLKSLLQTYWNEDAVGEQSRREFFARVMGEKFRADLLLKRQNAIISPQESQHLHAVFLPGSAVGAASADHLRLEKVQIHAPYQHYVDLASTLMISNSHTYLYTQSRGLQVLKDLDDLNDTLLAMLKAAGHGDELLNFLSLDERSAYIGMDHVQVSGQPVEGDVFQSMLEDIVAKQFDNLEHALRLYRRSASETDLAALLDHALDVRTMLDCRLLEQDAGGRWSVHPVTSGNGRPSTVLAETAKRHLQRLQAVDAAMAIRRSQHPSLSALVAHALDLELTKKRLALNADEVFINTYASPIQEREERLPVASSSMVAHFFARVTGQAEALVPSPLTWFYGPRSAGVAQQLHSLSVNSFNAIIEQVMSTFAQHELREVPHLLLDNNKAELSHGLLQGLSGETDMSRLYKCLSPRHLALLDCVLNADSLRSRDSRHGLNGFLPDAFALSLHLDAATQPELLANCFVLTERGGLDPDHSGAAMLWTPRTGFEAFASIKELVKVLGQRLLDPLARWPLIENLPVSRRLPHQAYRAGPLHRIDDHLLDNRQSSYSAWLRAEIDHLLAMKPGAQRFQDCMDALIRRAPPSNLPRAIAMAHAMIRQQSLPVWLGMAPPHEQIRHAELLEQYRLSAPQERDYLHSITPLREQVVNTLTRLLDARLPGQALNPDNILIPYRIDLNGRTQTLTDFALRHLPDLRAERIRPRSRTATPLPEALDGDAIVQLVRQLDLKRIYQQKLITHLDQQNEDARARRQLFCRQLPWQLLQYAHEQMLNEQLSAKAWSLIQQVFDMPDAVARAGVNGATAAVRHLELIATEGAAGARALGCYLIGPEADASGPLVLYAPYSPLPSLKEFANEAALLSEFTNAGVLQDWIVGQLEVAQRATYRNMLGNGWHDGLAEIKLGATAMGGNLLKQLFADNVQMLLQMLGAQFSASGKLHWDAITCLLTQEIPNGLKFLAGKLAYPLVVWRSYTLFKASAEDLQEHRWRHALKTFALGVAELASLRKALDSPMPPTPSPMEQPSVNAWLQAAAPAAASLSELDITAPERTQLHTFEHPDVALSDLAFSSLTQVYRDDSNLRNFVPLAGKTYSVKRAGERWRLSAGDRSGPYLQRSAQGQWTLDLNHHHPRYGKTLSRYADRRATRLAERDAINIEAVGMREIAALSSWKAQCIDEALNVATYYAVNCKRNLLHFAALREPASRLGRFFSEFFGVATLAPGQVQRIERRIDEVLDELINHTLTGPDSMRFVSGTHRYSPQDSFAFVVPDDADHKIYLLDRFFDPPMDIYQNRLTTPFNISAHARATVLIHEITHIKSLTEDLAYLDSMRPFPDLINVAINGATLMKTDLDNLRDNALSISTPVSMLFKTWDAFSQQWEDFGSRRFTAPLLDKVLSTTGARTLEEARSVFMSNSDKRIDTILANADSVTCLISELGRDLDAGA